MLTEEQKSKPYAWMAERILAEKRKHEQWAGDEWAMVAAAKIHKELEGEK